MSRYNLFRPGDQDGTVLAFNTRTLSFLTVTKSDYLVLTEAIDSASIDALPIGLRFILQEFGFIIPDDLDELYAIRRDMFLHRFSRGALALTLLPTLGCNLACTYCYESGVRRGGLMSPEVEEAILQYINDRCPRDGMLGLTWYGGEPLLAPDLILRVSAAAKAIADQKHTEFGLSVITNGTLLTADFLSSLEEIAPPVIQITLDGPREVNDRRKLFATHTSSMYDTVIRNLASLKPRRSSFSIRCNIDRTNADAAAEMLPDLARLNIPGLVAYSSPVSNWAGGGCPDGLCYPYAEFAPIRRRFDRAAKAVGLGRNDHPTPRSHYCLADREFSYIFGQDGSIYKCWNHIGDKRYAIGNLLSGPPVVKETTQDVDRFLCDDPTSDPDCRECVALPMCMGGCPSYRLATGHRLCDLDKYGLDDVLMEWAVEWRRKAL